MAWREAHISIVADCSSVRTINGRLKPATSETPPQKKRPAALPAMVAWLHGRTAVRLAVRLAPGSSDAVASGANEALAALWTLPRCQRWPRGSRRATDTCRS